MYLRKQKTCSQKTIKLWWKKSKRTQMERYTMFWNWKNQYSKDEYTTQSNLQIQCNSCQIAKAFSTELKQKNLTVFMGTPKTPNSQSNLKKEKWSRRNQTSWLETILKIYNNQNSVVLAQKQKYKPMYRIESPDINPWT